MRTMILLTISTLCLTACVPAALVTGAATGGAVIYDNRGFSAMQKDHDARAHTTRALRADTALAGSHIEVTVYHGIALLVGQAQTDVQKKAANDLVAKQKGVTRVYNEITISPPSSSLQRMQDSLLTSKVKSAMILKPSLRSSNVKIVTENGSVYLMGQLSHDQANLAAETARHVGGVKKVIKVFIYS